MQHLQILLVDLRVHVQPLRESRRFDHPVRRRRLWSRNLVAALDRLDEVPSLTHGLFGCMMHAVLVLRLRLG